MKIILTGIREPSILADCLRERHIAFEFIPLEHLVGSAKESSLSGLSADVIACVVHPDSTPKSITEYQRLTLASVAAKVVKELRSLQNFQAMKDGRKWAAVPFVMIVNHLFNREGIRETVDANVTDISGDYTKNLNDIREIVSDYWQRLLGELDNLGLIITYEQGRYRVGPGLAARDEGLESALYYSPADRKQGTQDKYFTLNRDVLGIQYEIELFEALINSPDVQELDLQRFFEENPHFLAPTKLMQPLPHVSLVDNCGKVLVPDFVIKPIVAAQRDSNWQVLDLKHPQAKLLAGRSNHKRFSQDVMKAINQVKDYKDYFENPAHASVVTESLGQPLRHPRLGVLIGRMPTNSDMEPLENAQAREPEVRIVTYDEILETQKQLVG